MDAVRPVVVAAYDRMSPENFHSDDGEDSRFQDTLERVSAPEFLPPLILGPQAFASEIVQQCHDIDITAEDILLFDTDQGELSLMQLSAMWARGRGEGASIPLFFCPPGQAVDDFAAFERACGQAADCAMRGHVVLMGAVIRTPDLEHVLIKVGERLDAGYPGHVVQSLGAGDGAEPGCVWHTAMVCAGAEHLLSLLNPASKISHALSHATKKSDHYEIDLAANTQAAAPVLAQQLSKLAVQSLFTDWTVL